MSDIQKLVFHKRDFLYDNGLVNFCLYLCEITGQQPVTGQKIDEFSYTFGETVKVALKKHSLEIEGEKEEIEYLFTKMRETISDNALYRTDKYRLWWDNSISDFVCEPKINSDTNNVVNNIMMNNYTLISETGLSLDEIQLLESRAIEKYSQEYGKQFDYKKGNGFFNMQKNPKLYSKIDFEKRRQERINDLIKGDKNILKLGKICNRCDNRTVSSFISDSNSYFYETGGHSFTDCRKGTNEYICCYCNLFNKLSNYFIYYNYSSKNYKFYFDTVNLTDLIGIKYFLDIKNKNVEIYNKKEEKTKVIPTNIDQTHNYVYGVGIYTRTLLLIWNIYQKIKDSKNRNEYTDIEGMKRYILHIVEDDGIFVTDYKKVSRLDKLFLFFDHLKENKIDQVLKNLLRNINTVNSDDKSQGLLNEFSKNIINFEKKLMNTTDQNGQNALKANTGGTPDIDKFISLFQEEINATDKEKMLHNFASEIGKKIGRIAFITESKDLLYRIREIGSIRGFATFFEEFSHRVLKFDGKEGVSINKDFKEKEEAFLKALSPTNWKEARGYISIYAINNYLSNKAYRENKSKESN